MMQPPPKEKLEISWDDVNSPDVDAKLKEQASKARADASFTSPAMSMNAGQLRAQQRTSIWYNTVFTMAVFGCLGGLLAWGAGELIRLKPATLEDAQRNWAAVESVKRRFAANIDTAVAQASIAAIVEEAGDNPYFAVLRNDALTPQQKQAELARVSSDLATKQFIANVLKYGLIGMVIALCLAIAEPVVDRNVHGAVMNGAVGAMLGLFGGVVVSLFVDRLHAALGGAGDLSAAASSTAVAATTVGGVTVRQWLADAITYAVIGMFLLVAPGVMMRNGRKLMVGLAGGFAGGLVGGLLMAPLSRGLEMPTVARALVLVAIGLVAGAATGLIENAAKTGWLKVVQGFIAGKQFILYRATTYIGAAPDCHIYLFKDPAIGRRHAAVHIVPGGFDLEDLPLGSPTFVNGKPVTRVRLRTGDQIQIGQTAFTFQEKVKQG